MPAQLELPALPYEKWLTAKELAGRFALQEDSAYRWHDDGTIPERFVKYCGTRRLLFHPHVIPYLETHFAAAH
jgi:hypothetical protein